MSNKAHECEVAKCSIALKSTYLHNSFQELKTSLRPIKRIKFKKFSYKFQLSCSFEPETQDSTL